MNMDVKVKKSPSKGKQFFIENKDQSFDLKDSSSGIRNVVPVEEHSIIGGLGGAVAEVLSEKCPTKMLRIGVKDTFGESGPAVKLLEKYELDAAGIYKQIKAFI